MNIKEPVKIRLSLRWVLALAFLVVLAAEAYLGYKYIHASYFSQPPELPEDSVVRVNFKAYQATIGKIEALYEYQPGVLNLPRANPFQ